MWTLIESSYKCHEDFDQTCTSLGPFRHWLDASNWIGLGKITNEVFFNPLIIFKSNSFIYFHFFLENIHETILMKQITNLNSGIDHFAFECQTNQIWAQVIELKPRWNVMWPWPIFTKSRRCEASMFGNSHKIIGKLTHTFFITWGEWGVRCYVSSILITLINYHLFNTHLNVVKLKFLCNIKKMRDVVSRMPMPWGSFIWMFIHDS